MAKCIQETSSTGISHQTTASRQSCLERIFTYVLPSRIVLAAAARGWQLGFPRQTRTARVAVSIAEEAESMVIRLNCSRSAQVVLTAARRRAKPSRWERRHMAAAHGTTSVAGMNDQGDVRLPVTVITGFLGSGKTTLINHVLRSSQGRRIALIENEFGEIGVDADLIVGREALAGGESVTLLENGCICCSVRDDLVVALLGLVARGGIEHILIETTGIANPAPIIQTMLVEPTLSSAVRVEGICTVVDAAHAAVQLSRGEGSGVHGSASENENEAVAQIAYADRLVINKADLVPPEELAALQGRVRAINGLASIREAQRAVVPPEFVMAISGFALHAVPEQVSRQAGLLVEEAGKKSPTVSKEHADIQHGQDRGRGEGSATAHDHKHDHGQGHTHDHEPGHAHAHAHAHDGVESCAIVIDGAMDLERLNTWLGMLLSRRGDDIYRMKGILNIDGERRRFVFQGVHQMFEGIPDREWRPEEERVNKMVFIGKDLPRQLMKECFEECLVDIKATVQA